MMLHTYATFRSKKTGVRIWRYINRVIEDALRKTLFTKRNIKKNKVTLVTVRGSGLRHGINLDDNQSLLDTMDE